MFEAIHGSAPDIAGKNIANPSGMLQSAVLMLVHLGKVASASKIQNAWLRTLEEGIHTADNFREGVSKQKVGTQEFAQAVIARLGQMPEQLAVVDYPENDSATFDETQNKMQGTKRTIAKKCLVGVDVFLNWDASDRNPQVLGKLLEALAGPEFRFSVISNRGVKVYPGGNPQTLCTDHWRCRFILQNDHPDSRIICTLLMRIAEAGLDAVKTENLYEFDGVRGYSQVQGE